MVWREVFSPQQKKEEQPSSTLSWCFHHLLFLPLLLSFSPVLLFVCLLLFSTQEVPRKSYLGQQVSLVERSMSSAFSSFSTSLKKQLRLPTGSTRDTGFLLSVHYRAKENIEKRKAVFFLFGLIFSYLPSVVSQASFLL